MIVTGYRLDLERHDLIAAAHVDFMPAIQGRFSAPSEVDPREKMRGIWPKHQGPIGSCQGHANSEAIEFDYLISNGEPITVSPWYQYRKTQQVDGIHGDNGSTIAGGMRVAKTFGGCPLDVVPYPSRYNNYPLPAGADEAAAPNKIRSVSVIKSYDEAIAYLGAGQGGIEIGIAWSDPKLTTDGTWSRYAGGGGGHALFICGYLSDNRLILLNSWGAAWGDGGYAYLTPDCFNAMCRAPQSVMLGSSGMAEPHPRKWDWTKLPVL